MDRNTIDPIEFSNERLWLNIANEVTNSIGYAENLQKRKSKQAHIEIEIQFGTYSEVYNQKYGKFGSYVSKSEFNRVMKFMKETLRLRFQEHVIEDKIDRNERISYDYKTQKTTYYEKDSVWQSYQLFPNKETGQFLPTRFTTNNGIFLAKEYGIRVNVSNEFLYNSSSRNFNTQKIRNKNRTSFKIDQIGTLDLTEATTTDGDKSQRTSYEIELELLDKNTFGKNNSKIMELCGLIKKIMQDSELCYTNSEKIKMYQYVSKQLGIKDGKLKFAMLPEARDLKLEDMVYGGLVGNKETNYCATFKADGIRRLIVFMPNQIWAIMPGNPDANLLYQFKESKNGSCIAPYGPGGFIVDGELLTKPNRKDRENCKYMFYIFDCLVENNNDVRMKTYDERMEKAQQITRYNFDELSSIDPILNKTIRFSVKKFYNISGVNHFFETMKLMFLEIDDLPYENDGLMFIPVRIQYNMYFENPDVPPIYQRTLTDYPDICKWKPQGLRSIDFLVEFEMLADGKRKVILKTGGKDENDRNPVIFEGSNTFPLKNRIDTDHAILSNLPSHSIVEFYWDERKQLLIPMRVRLDKLSPNRYFTAMNVWKNIFYGIDQETLQGKTFQLMRSYHNKIKLNLYKNIKYTRGHKVLLDIGSGRGGDIKKWNEFELIFAVEPNKDHIKELESRLKSYGLENKVIIINTGGEDYDYITNVIKERYGEKVSTVSLMLSLSFFQGDLRKGLRKTIEQNLQIGGEVLVFTINGDTVKQMYLPSSEEYKEKTLYFLDAKTTYEGKTGKLYIDIPSTIVSEQEEFPPKISEFFYEWDNFLPLNVSRADKELFLNSDEKAFTNLYTSFQLVLMSDKRSNLEIERLVPYDEIEDFGDFYGISVLPSDYFYLSAVLKAVNEEYQNDNNLEFRRNFALQVWDEIYSELSREEKDKYSLPWNDTILELLSKVFEIQILNIQNNKKRIFGKLYERKIIIIDKYILSKTDEQGLLQTIF
jgi:hypothetical protein